MKLLLIFFLGIIPSTLIWNENFNEAQQQAKTSHKQILINFQDLTGVALVSV